MQACSSVTALNQQSGVFLRSAAAPRRHAAAGARSSRGAPVVVRAAAKLPQGATQPRVSPVAPPPKFGFVDNAERLNSRAAMIGFFSLLLLEAVANQGILDMMGVVTGKGLNIGF